MTQYTPDIYKKAAEYYSKLYDVILYEHDETYYAIRTVVPKDRKFLIDLCNRYKSMMNRCVTNIDRYSELYELSKK